MSKIIIGIHGLKNKPPKRTVKRWWKQAIREGQRTIGRRKWGFRFDLAYWADILHPTPLNPRINNPEHPRFVANPYLPAQGPPTPPETTIRGKILDVLERQMDKIFLNKDMTLNFSRISDMIIRRYFEDLDAYYTQYCDSGKSTLVKDCIRNQLSRLLQKHRKKRIMIIAHSMGSIVAYDVLTQIAPDIPIHTFVTVGSPLGSPAIIGKIAEELNRKTRLATPANIQSAWHNYADLHDKVAANYNLADDYTLNRRGIGPKDHIVRNDYHIREKANPHNSYGYLRTPQLSEVIHRFLTED